jgi:hypothetical protein
MVKKSWLVIGIALLVLAVLCSLSGCSAFYVEGGLSARDRGEYHIDTFDHVESQHGGVIESGFSYRASTDPQNPYGRVAMGYAFELPHHFTIDANVAHASSIETKNDHGFNSVNLSVRWHPFAQ